MSYVGEKTIREVHDWLMNGAREEVLSTREIQDGYFRFWRSKILSGDKHVGDHQAYCALRELRRRGLVKNVPPLPGPRNKGRGPLFWALNYNAPREVKVPDADLEAILRVLREGNLEGAYVTHHTIHKRCGLDERAQSRAICELLRRGEIEEITVRRNKSYSRAFREKPREKERG